VYVELFHDVGLRDRRIYRQTDRQTEIKNLTVPFANLRTRPKRFEIWRFDSYVKTQQIRMMNL